MIGLHLLISYLFLEQFVNNISILFDVSRNWQFNGIKRFVQNHANKKSEEGEKDILIRPKVSSV